MSSGAMATDVSSQEGCDPTNGIATTNLNESYRPLFEAVVRGDVMAVNEILDQDVQAAMANIMMIRGRYHTALDVAVITAHDKMVENLVKRIPEERSDSILSRALKVALKGGKMRIVKTLLDKNSMSEDSLSSVPLNILESGSGPIEKDLVWYLATLIKDPPSDDAMRNLILTGYSDVGLYLARKYLSQTMLMEILSQLATMGHLFYSGARLSLWEKFIYKCTPLCFLNSSLDDSEGTKMARVVKWFKISLWNIATKSVCCISIKEIGELKCIHNSSFELVNLAFTKMKTRMTTSQMHEFLITSRIVLNAADFRIFEILKLTLRYYPELTWREDLINELVKAVIKARDVESFRLLNTAQVIQELRSHKERHSLMDSIVELPQENVQAYVYGEAVVLQRELQWYKIVEDIASPLPSGHTFKKEFLKNRKDMLEGAAQWMKTTSTACTTFAGMIITIVLAAVFVIPGGNINGAIETPIAERKSVFMIAAAAALFLAFSAAWIFLSVSLVVSNSSHAADQFLQSLPKKVIWGLGFLSLSLITVMVGFSSSVTLVEGNYFFMSIVLVPPIIVLSVMIGLLVELLISTYCPRLFRPLKI